MKAFKMDSYMVKISFLKIMRTVGRKWIEGGKETLKDISQLLWKHGVVNDTDSENVALSCSVFLNPFSSLGK